MDKVQFLDSLPTSEPCHNCGTLVRAVDWQVSPCGGGQWLGLCIATCSTCGNVHIAAAGSSKAAQLDAQYVRQKLFREIPKK
jgi:hypothetical protein